MLIKLRRYVDTTTRHQQVAYATIEHDGALTHEDIDDEVWREQGNYEWVDDPEVESVEVAVEYDDCPEWQQSELQLEFNLI